MLGENSIGLQVLNPEILVEIKEASMRVLSDVGVLIKHDGALQLLQDAGASIEWRTGLVKIPSSLVEKSLAFVPHALTLKGLTEEDDLVVSDHEHSYFRPAIGVDYILDHRTHERRKVDLCDLENWVRLVERLDNVQILAPLYPQDVPENIRDIRAVEVSLRNSRKPMVICAYSKENLNWMTKLISAVPRGSTERIMVVISCDSPLSYSNNQVDLMLAAARQGFPILVNSAGVSMTGCLIQLNAEALAAITLLQTAFSGAPIIYDIHPLVFDMKTGNASFGYAELGLLNAAFVELGRSYGFLTESSGLKTDSHLCDEQAGFEKIMTGYLSTIAGANMISGVGCLSTAATASLLQLVIDNDIISQLRQISKGVPIKLMNQDEAAIARVGPGGHFLTDDHTLENFREEYFISNTVVRDNWEVWHQEGGNSISGIAAEQLESILENGGEDVVEVGVGEDLERIMIEAQLALQ